jgi:excisionase family DNA binding protein
MNLLHMSRKSVYRLLDSGRIRYARPTSRKLLIYAIDVEKLLDPVNR